MYLVNLYMFIIYFSFVVVRVMYVSVFNKHFLLMTFSRYSIPYNFYRIKECVLSCLLYMSYSHLAVGYEELYPVFAATSHKYSKYDKFNVKGMTLLIGEQFLIL